VLYDDRRESFGTKFKDADLIVAPLRLTLTPRSLKNGGVEVKLRRENDGRVVPIRRSSPWCGRGSSSSKPNSRT
jgi:prolyl-tRNA synthetase